MDQRMDRWQGYLPMARASLLSTFERAAHTGVQFSPAERALFLACEFWTAVSVRKLVVHLGADPIGALRYMTLLYSGIGALGVTSDMVVAVGELASSSHPQVQYNCLIALQERLLKTRDPVDRLIARFAGYLGLDSPGDSNWPESSKVVLVSA